MASDHAAGAATLVIQDLGAGWSDSAVVNRLATTADDLGPSGLDALNGYGLADAEEASTGV